MAHEIGHGLGLFYKIREEYPTTAEPVFNDFKKEERLLSEIEPFLPSEQQLEYVSMFFEFLLRSSPSEKIFILKTLPRTDLDFGKSVVILLQKALYTNYCLITKIDQVNC